jgi:glycine/D-amino acid oxidase-like deaminating enzyme/nitrite reductase/ring-hydroxylating ferredoxin subunit
MNPQDRAAASPWLLSPLATERPPLTAGTDTEVCVVGAGIAGLTTAWLLAREGVRVTVLDALGIAGGETQRTTAHLASELDDRLFHVERIHGTRGMRTAIESHAGAIDQIEATVAELGIDCGFRRVDGYLMLGPGHDEELLQRELEAARRAGRLDVALVANAPLPSFSSGPCLRFPDQGQFHPLHYLTSLARAIEERGGRIHGGTHVTEVHGGKDPHVVTRAGQRVRARAVVVATNSPIHHRVLLQTKLSAYLTYAIALRAPHSTFPPLLLWDTADPYHYVRMHEEPGSAELLVIVGGEDHRTGQQQDGEARHQRLEQWARERFPGLGPVVNRWAGEVMETIDGLAFIGRDTQDNVYVAAGDSGMGMTHGTIAGMVLSAQIQGREHPWAALYDATRKPVKAAGDYVVENAKTAARYADWLSPADVGSSREIENGCGALVREGIKKVAVYRDENGESHRFSAVCPHLKCIVQWNDVAKTWDCPCHGSRFDKLGKVIHGPATSDLEPLDRLAPRSQAT